MKSALAVVFVLSVTVGILSIPRKVEGVYSAGRLISCMCDGSDYIRFHGGFVVHYSSAHEPADLLGRYEVKSDGSVEVYMLPLRKGESEELLFSLGRPRIGFALASTPEESGSCLLMRFPTTSSITDMIARQEVSQVSIPDDTKIVTTFYDSSLAVIREETKPIKNRKAEQAAGVNGGLAR
ncbi:hypothetical protein [Luteolibacter pohnpeiensis]|nr:hypothetical protein [Luteolibacter pohnpeiensis]